MINGNKEMLISKMRTITGIIHFCDWNAAMQFSPRGIELLLSEMFIVQLVIKMWFKFENCQMLHLSYKKYRRESRLYKVIV